LLQGDFNPFWSPNGRRILFVDVGNSSHGSRDDDDALGNGTNNSSDLLLINLRTFPWHMFLPAIEHNGN